MSQPDIIVPLTSDPSGPKAWVWIEAVEITRQGASKVEGIEQLEDRWRISLPIRASLATPDGKDVERDAHGSEISVPSPIPSRSFDLADLLHDPAVQALAVALRDVTLRMASGDLNPLPKEIDNVV
jgi:hypothetical protein